MNSEVDSMEYLYLSQPPFLIQKAGNNEHQQNACRIMQRHVHTFSLWDPVSM